MTPPAEVRFYPELAQADDGYRLLDCIRQVEQPAGAGQMGAHGELGPYQFRRDTWNHLTHLPFTPEFACDPIVSLAVAVLHYHEIREALLHTDRGRATPANIAACWNAGCHAVISGQIPQSTRDYAARVCNLFYTHAR